VICPNCNTRFPVGNFCPQCGTPAPHQTSAPIVEAEKIVRKHYDLLEIETETYKNGNYSCCIERCLEDIILFPEFQKAYPVVYGPEDLPFYPAFVTLAKIYEKQGLYDKAIEACELAMSYGLSDGTKGGFAARKTKLEKKKLSPPALEPQLKNEIDKIQNKRGLAESFQVPDCIKKLPWYISVSFMKSSSDNFPKAIFLAKSSNYFLQTEYDGKEIYQAFFSHYPSDYLKFIQLYELVSGWKSSFASINGELVDRKIVSGLNYCYGDRCRSGRDDFCYGASFMTVNPFGCHRLQISAGNRPWWTFSEQIGNVVHINKDAIRERAKQYGTAYYLCPNFNMEYILMVIDGLPDSIPLHQYQRLINGEQPDFSTTSFKNRLANLTNGDWSKGAKKLFNKMFK
jgi:hypothetical protein